MNSKDEKDDEETRLRELLKSRSNRRKNNPDIGTSLESQQSFSTASEVPAATAASPGTSGNNTGSGRSDKTSSNSTNPTPSYNLPRTSDRARADRGASGSQHQSTQQRARGRRRKRERRRMNREARRRGDPLPYDRRGSSREYYSGSRGGPDAYGRWERDMPPPGYHRDDRQFSDRRGYHQDWRAPPNRNEYDYSSYRSRSRSRSPYRRRRRNRSRSPSSASDQSDDSKSDLSRSMSSSRSRSSSASASKSSSRSRSRSRSHSGRGKRSASSSQSRSRSRSHSQSHGSRNRSQRRSSDHGSRGSSREDRRRDTDRGDRESQGRGGANSDSRSRKRKHRGTYNKRQSQRRKHRSDSYDSYSDSSSSASSSSQDGKEVEKEGETVFSKDQRTVFVTQLVMRATEKDIRRYFRRKVGCKVKEVILLRDKRTGSHKGCAYVQMSRIEDVNKAVGVAGQPPDFQRFPILVKASEAEKNYVIPASSSVVTASMMGTSSSLAPLLNKDGQVVESQKVYVGGLDHTVSEEHIFALFSQFGQLEKVSMQMDPSTKTSKGYAFLTFRDPKEANLAIKTMSNQVLAGRPMKTGWANQASTVPGVNLVTSEDFPPEAAVRAKKALAVLAQLMGSSTLEASDLSATAEEAIEAAMGASLDSSSQVSSKSPSAGGKDLMSRAAAAAATVSTEKAVTKPPEETQPTRFLLVHNMFDKDEETEKGWESEIKEDFMEEGGKFGKIESVVVMSQEAGGKLYAVFEATDAAVNCAKNLSGRWFDKRQLRVDFVQETDIPKE